LISASRNNLLTRYQIKIDKPKEEEIKVTPGFDKMNSKQNCKKKIQMLKKRVVKSSQTIMKVKKI